MAYIRTILLTVRVGPRKNANSTQQSAIVMKHHIDMNFEEILGIYLFSIVFVPYCRFANATKWSKIQHTFFQHST